MLPTPVCLTFDHLGRGKDVGLGQWIRPASDAPEIVTAIPRVLDLLTSLGATGTFYVEGWSALHHRPVLRRLAENGHEIGLHGWVHERWSTLSLGEQERLLRDGRAAIESIGIERIGFRAPHGDIARESFSLLSEIGFHHDSSRLLGEVQDLLPRRVTGVPHIPFAWPLVDFWLLRKAAAPVPPERLADAWTQEALNRRAAGEPVIVDIHPFFAALDERIWASVLTWARTIDEDPRFAWSSVGALADALPPGVPPGPNDPPSGWAAYLGARGHALAAAPSASSLPGGVSASVARIGDLVVKRPLTRLSVPMEWLADTDRAVAEATAMRRAAELAPAVVDLDRDTPAIVMEYVSGITWKDQLMSGCVDPATAATAGRLLARTHALDPAGLRDPKRLEELRLGPYLRTAAQRLPEHADALNTIADRLARGSSCLVHGDYSPKNLLVDGERVTVLDWEVAHAGDPMFDIGFLLTHLICKAIVMPQHRDALHRCADAFLEAYRESAPTELDEPWAVQILGALILGRTDGLSPLSYLEDHHRTQLRALAGELIDKRGSLWPL